VQEPFFKPYPFPPPLLFYADGVYTFFSARASLEKIGCDGILLSDPEGPPPPFSEICWTFRRLSQTLSPLFFPLVHPGQRIALFLVS